MTETSVEKLFEKYTELGDQRQRAEWFAGEMLVAQIGAQNVTSWSIEKVYKMKIARAKADELVARERAAFAEYKAAMNKLRRVK